MDRKGILCGTVLGYHRDPAFVAVLCIWDEELGMVVLAGPMLSRLTVEISCHRIFLLRCSNIQCVCPKITASWHLRWETSLAKAAAAQLHSLRQA